MSALDGKVALVAGATRGSGRGIACMLGAAGATVYCSGRSTRARRPAEGVESDTAFVLSRRPETVESIRQESGGRGSG